MIIIRGRNIDPVDLELAAGEVMPDSARGPGKTASCAAFALNDASPEEEKICLVLEVDRDMVSRAEEWIREVRARLVGDFGVPVARVALVRRGGVPRTTSGKIQRRLCRSLYRAGELSIIEEGRFD